MLVKDYLKEVDGENERQAIAVVSIGSSGKGEAKRWACSMVHAIPWNALSLGT